MKTKTAVVAALLAAVTLAFAIEPAVGDGWPIKPIRWIVPVAPGGATDATARIIQQPVSKIIGQPVIIDNKPGGAGIIATADVVQSEPDGYTFGLIYTSHAANPSLLDDLPYDSERDVTPVAFFWRASLAFSVYKDVPIKSVQDLISASRQKPRSIAYATGGVGLASHLAGAAFEQDAAIRMTHAPYRGAGRALNDLLAGHVPMMISNLSMVQPHIKAGPIRVIAVTSPDRSPLAPDVPTIAESGFSGFEASEWIGFIGPANLSPAIAEKMNAAIWEALQTPAVVKQFEKMGLTTDRMSPGEFVQFLKDETRKMTAIIQAAHIKS